MDNTVCITNHAYERRALTADCCCSEHLPAINTLYAPCFIRAIDCRISAHIITASLSSITPSPPRIHFVTLLIN